MQPALWPFYYRLLFPPWGTAESMMPWSKRGEPTEQPPHVPETKKFIEALYSLVHESPETYSIQAQTDSKCRRDFDFPITAQRLFQVVVPPEVYPNAQAR